VTIADANRMQASVTPEAGPSARKPPRRTHFGVIGSVSFVDQNRLL